MSTGADLQAVPVTPAPDTTDGNGTPAGDTRRVSSIVLEGCLDAVEARRAYGWVRNPDDDQERCTVEVQLDGEVLGRVTADRERVDLRDAGIGDGRYAFEYTFDAPLDAEARARVSARANSSDGSATLDLERFAPRSDASAPAAVDDALRLALGRIAAHQVNAFSRQAATLESLCLVLEDLDRRIQERPRIGDPSLESDEFDGRMSALEGMYLRFDETLQRLQREREADVADMSRRGGRTGWLLAIAIAFAAGAALGKAVELFGG